MKLSVVIFVAILDFVASQCTSGSERSANAVELKFYRVQRSEWIEDSLSGKTAIQLIDVANTYCANNPEECGLSSCCTNKFKESMVITISGYPEDSKKDMLLKLSLDLPENSTISSTPNCVVPKAALRTIVGNAREAIHTETGFWITYVDDEFYGIPPPTDLNNIIIPIACAVIILLAILTVLLTVWNKKREESLRRKKIIEQRKSKSKPVPVYVVEKSDPKVPSGISGENGSRQKPKRKDQLYKDGMKKGTAKKTASIASEDSAIKVDENTRHRQAFSYAKELEGARGYDEQGRGYQGLSLEGPPASHLKPLDTNEEDYERSPEKKKKKKKKRSKSKETMETITDGFSNADD